MSALDADDDPAGPGRPAQKADAGRDIRALFEHDAVVGRQMGLAPRRR
ncbi:MAG: hypothetical protein U5K56_13370 [Halioglobus sp.]|nr:hypothetical protein [Halioglobus sp.]